LFSTNKSKSISKPIQKKIVKTAAIKQPTQTISKPIVSTVGDDEWASF